MAADPGRILSPFQRIAAAARAIASGDLDLRTESDTGDDPDTIARELDQAVARLREAGLVQRRHVARIQAIASLTRELGETVTDIDRLLQAVATRLADVTGDLVEIRLLSAEGRAHDLSAAHHPDPGVLADFSTHMLGTTDGDPGVWAPMVREKRPLRLDLTPFAPPPEASAGQAAFLERHPVRGILGAPLVARGTIVGVMAALRIGLDATPFSADDETFLQSIATRLALAVENARLLTDAQAAARDLGRLLDITDTALAHLSVEDVLDRILERIRQHVEADVAFVMEHGEDDPEMTVRAVAGDSGGTGVGSRVPMRGRLSEEAARTGKQAMVDDLLATDRVSPLLREKGIRSVVVTPLKREGRVIGSLLVGARLPARYRAADLHLLDRAAERVATAMGTARLNQDLRSTIERLVATQEHERRAQARLAAVATMTAEFNAALPDLDRLLGAIVRRTSELDGDLCIVRLLSDDGARLEVAAVHHPDAGVVAAIEDLVRTPGGRSDVGLWAPIVAGAPLRIDLTPGDIPPAASPLQAAFLRRIPTIGFLAVPLIARGRILGGIGLNRLASSALGPFDADDVALLNAVGERAALAIDNARLLAESRTGATELEHLLDVTDAAVSNLPAGEVLDTMLERIRRYLDADLAYVFQLEAGREEMTVRAASGITPRAPVGSRMPVASTVSEQVVATGRPILIDDLLATDWASPHARALGMRSVVAAPLIYESTAIGTILACSRIAAKYGQAELRLIERAAARVAAAMTTSQLYRDIQDVVGRLLVAQEEERRRVAYEVHDGVAQSAAATHQFLQALVHESGSRADQSLTLLNLAATAAQRTVREARRIIAQLRPTLLDDRGLVPALRAEVDALLVDGIAVAFEDRLSPVRLEPDQETALYRVAVEALTNARRHAPGAPITITLEAADGLVRLCVRDRGPGFDPEGVRAPGSGEHIGLDAMRERVALVEGRLRITSSPADGTAIVAEISPRPRVDPTVAGGHTGETRGE